MKVFKVVIKGQLAERDPFKGQGQDEYYLLVANDFQSAGRVAEPLCNTGQISEISYWGEVVGYGELPILKAKDYWVTR